MVEPKLAGPTTEADKIKLQSTIYIHTKYSGYNPDSDHDSFFLSVHIFVVSWAIENLKYMHSIRAVATISECAQKLFMESVGELERVTYWFHIIQKEIQALAYSIRVNDMYNYIKINMDVFLWFISIWYIHFYDLFNSYANFVCIVVIIDAPRHDDWDAAQIEIPRLQLQQKVILSTVCTMPRRSKKKDRLW